jgi:hypothetical protein
MSRILDIIIILVVTIILSVWTSISMTKPEREEFQDISVISRNISQSGMNAIACAPSSPAQTTILLGPTLNDLFNTRFLKPEYTQNLGGIDNLNARSCLQGKSNSLSATLDSNKTDCDITIDFQSYTLNAISLGKLCVSPQTSRTELVVAPDQNMISFLLHRPIFFTLDNSRPYMIDFIGRNPYLFSTYKISSVTGYRDAGAEWVRIPIRQLIPNGTNLFRSNTKDILNIINETRENLRVVNGKRQDYVDLSVTLYCAKIKASLGDIVSVPDSSHTAFMRRANETPTTNMALMLSRFNATPPLSANNDQRNPTLSVRFTVKIARPNTGGVPQWMRQWNSLLKIGDDDWEHCNLQGRGILLVETRPWSIRNTGNIPFREVGASSTDFVCLDFTNVDVDINSENVVDWCGSERSRVYLWIPTGVSVNVAYIVSSTMKIVVASFYDEESKKKQLIFSHSYQNGSVMNGIRPTIRQFQNITVQNLVNRKNMDPSVFSLTNVSTSYGMMDIQDWFSTQL